MGVNFPTEMMFGVDNFNKQKTLTPAESLAQNILNILLMKPGTFPSLPHLGIDITQYLYKFKDDINGDKIKDLIEGQCNEMMPYLYISEIKVYVGDYNGAPTLIIYMAIEDDTYTLGFLREGTSGNILYNYDINLEF